MPPLRFALLAARHAGVCHASVMLRRRYGLPRAYAPVATMPDSNFAACCALIHYVITRLRAIALPRRFFTLLYAMLIRHLLLLLRAACDATAALRDSA